VTDHRIGLTVHNLTDLLGGDLDEVIAALRQAEQQSRLATLEDG
jgi:peptide chain release factor 1